VQCNPWTMTQRPRIEVHHSLDDIAIRGIYKQVRHVDSVFFTLNMTSLESEADGSITLIGIGAPRPLSNCWRSWYARAGIWTPRRAPALILALNKNFQVVTLDEVEAQNKIKRTLFQPEGIAFIGELVEGKEQPDANRYGADGMRTIRV
jgi:hypothetical protein